MKKFLFKILVYMWLVPAFYVGTILCYPDWTLNSIKKIKHSFTNSLGLNLKLTQIRELKPKPKVLFVGSSMCLNGINGKYIQNKTNIAVYNLSSFGQKMNENKSLLKVFNKQDVKVVYIPLNIMDFGKGGISGDFRKVKQYIEEENEPFVVLDYLRKFGSIKRQLIEYSKIKPNTFGILDFDSTGSIPIKTKDLITDSIRWNMKVVLPGREEVEETIFELKVIKSELNKSGIKLCVLILPVRKDKTSVNLEKFWFQIVSELKVLEIESVNLTGFNEPSLFFDYSHLNEEGSIAVGDTIVQLIKLKI